ncbi:hypothetical protein ACFWV1_18735 [Streptomyces sp. NPDC058700]|uniref:hypothetical protein n=1 Tax=Streptomyces sp. NPDC058700 TaxID=3346607 RepID=UPI0036662D2E
MEELIALVEEGDALGGEAHAGGEAVHLPGAAGGAAGDAGVGDLVQDVEVVVGGDVPHPWPRASGRRAAAGEVVRGGTSEVERQRRGGGAIIEASTAAGA